MNSAVEQIKDRLTIEEVVSWYVNLVPSGVHLKGKSPFNKEKTPSFFVSPNKGLFYCFSTGKGGDMITFIQEIEGIDFTAALKFLADKAGVEINSFDKKSGKRRVETKNALEVASRWYQVNLRRNEDVINYLCERGLTKETISKFQIGFAPKGNRLMGFFSRKGIPAGVAETAGLISGETGKKYDRFRDRIMFPIWNPQGDTVGFTGRIFLPTEKKHTYAKYMNSPEGELFHKSRVLYGYHFARKSIMETKQVFLVEGQFDVILAHQIGTKNCVGISGTALSDYQINLIKRFSNEVVLIFDSDRAGVAASEKIAMVAYKAGITVKAVLLPDGEDPADLISRDPDNWKKLISKPLSFVSYRLNITDFVNMSISEKMYKVKGSIFPIVSVIPSAVQRDIVCGQIADVLGVSVESVQSDLKDYLSEKNNPSFKEGQGKKNNLVEVGAPEESLTSLVFWLRNKEGSEFKEIETKINDKLKEVDLIDGLENMISTYDKDNPLVFRAELMFGTKHERVIEYAIPLIDSVELKFLQKKFNKTLQMLKKHEHNNDTLGVAKYQQIAQDLSHKIQKTKSRLHDK